MNYTREQAQALRSLKGAAASILLAFLITEASLKNKDLQLITGYSDKPVADALALLELHGWAQNNGRSYGWSLAAQPPLLPGTRKLSALAGSSSSINLDLLPKTSSNEEEEKEVRLWLIRAGVGRNSPKMRQLLSHNLSSNYVCLWVLEREWWLLSHDTPGFTGRTTFTVGTLIHILLERDQAPKQRCPDCLSHIPCNCRYIKT